MTPSFWRGKRVFLTGHTGFKGAWLCVLLRRMGAEVHGFALAPATDPSLYVVAGIDGIVTSTIADVRDLAAVKAAMDRCRPDVVIHMAAQALVRRSYADPLETISTNVMGTANIMEASRDRAGLRVIINVTTDKCYENKEWVWGYRENEPLGGKDVYSSSKACSELITQSYRSALFADSETRIATARAGNVIGGGDWSEDRLVPDILKALETDTPLMIRNPGATRPWQHVLEPLSGYVTLAEKVWADAGAAGAFNFGPANSEERSVAWIIDQMFRCWGKDRTWSLDTGANPAEAHFLRLDSSKAGSVLGWVPRSTTEQALEMVVDWHRAYLRGDDMAAFTARQIEAFFAMASET